MHTYTHIHIYTHTYRAPDICTDTQPASMSSYVPVYSTKDEVANEDRVEMKKGGDEGRKTMMQQ